MIRHTTFLIPILVAALASPAVADLSGILVYEDREFDFETGFTGSEPLVPAPNTGVRALDAATSAILGSGITASDGSFSIALPGSGARDVVVRAFSVSGNYGAERIVVQDLAGNVYSTTTAPFTVPDVAQDFDAGTIVAPQVDALGAIGGPFNILHRTVQAVDYAMAQGESALPSQLDVFWPDPAGSFATGSEFHMSTDDGFDDMVVLHEAGHVIHNLFSDSDNPGGSHTFTESDQNPALSLGEGWASFFAGAVRQFHGESNPGFYMDCDGDGTVGPDSIQLRMRFEDGFPFAEATGGEADEGAVFCALWDLVDRSDTDDGLAGDDDLIDGSFELAPGLDLDQAHWRVFTGDEVVQAIGLHVVDMWDGYLLDLGATAQAELTSAMSAWEINVFPDGVEPNDGAGSATPLSIGPDWGPTRTLYRSTAPLGAPGSGDVDAYAVQFDAGQVYELETRYPDGDPDAGTYADPALQLFSPAGELLASEGLGGAGRNAKIANFIAPEAGTYRVEVRGESTLRPTGSYELRVDQAVPKPPTISLLLPASVASVDPNFTPTLSLSGTDFGGTTSVTVAGVEASFSQFGDGIFVPLPLLPLLGDVPVVVTTPFGSDEVTLTVTEPAAPVLNINNGQELWFPGQEVQVKLGAGAGDVAFLLASFTAGPTSVAGLADLDIGAGNPAGLVLVEAFALDQGGTTGFSFSVDPLASGVTFFFQLAVFDAESASFPLLPSNVAQGRKF